MEEKYVLEMDKKETSKKLIDFAKRLDFMDNFKASLEKSDIKLMRENSKHDEYFQRHTGKE